MQRILVISRGRHDRHTSKSERRPQSRPLFQHPAQQAEQQQRRRRREVDEEEEELGWWQQPAKAEPESEELEDWQVERLEEAYAIGRRKVSVRAAISTDHRPLAMHSLAWRQGPPARWQLEEGLQAACGCCREQGADVRLPPPRVQVSKLSDELALDRSLILTWFKEFGQRPAK